MFHEVFDSALSGERERAPTGHLPMLLQDEEEAVKRSADYSLLIYGS